MNARRLSAPITLDGVLDENVWEEHQSLPYKMQQPQYGVPSERSGGIAFTMMRVPHLGGRLWLSDSSYLRPTTYKRDAFDGTTDYFGIIIDSYLDKGKCRSFFYHTYLLRWDGVVWNDAMRKKT